MKDIKTTNILLLIIVVPLLFYLLKILSFIFIPLIFAMFIALLFLPLMRWLNKRNVPRPVSIFVVVLIIAGIFKIGGELIQLSSDEILSADGLFLEKAESKLASIILAVEAFFGIDRVAGESLFSQYLQDNSMLKRFGTTLDFIGGTLSMTLMTAFFVILKGFHQ